MKTNLHLSILALGLFVVGCGGPAATSDKAETKTNATEQSKGTDATKTPDATTPAAPTAKASDLPGELKNAAFEYYGLELATPVDMEVVSSTQAAVLTGSQTTTLKEIKDGKATYVVERTGGLSALGTNELSLEKDGIYVKSSSIAKVGERDIEMPSKLDIGATWTTRTELDSGTKSMKLDSQFKVVGTEKITTKKATYPDALLVTSTGKGEQDGEKVQILTKSWFVKGRGNVKAEIKRIPAKGKSETITIQETK